MISYHELHGPLAALKGGFPHWWILVLACSLYVLALVLTRRTARQLLVGMAIAIGMYALACVGFNELYYFKAAETSPFVVHWSLLLGAFTALTTVALFNFAQKVVTYFARACLHVAACLMVSMTILSLLAYSGIDQIWLTPAVIACAIAILPLVLRRRQRTEDPAGIQLDGEGL